jgi:hypothetical protein
MKKFLLLGLISLVYSTVNAQLYTPIDTANLPVRNDAAKVYLEDAKQYYNLAKSDYLSGERSLFRKRCDNLDKVMNKDILSGQYIFDARFEKKIETVVHEIISKNPTIPSDIKFYVLRDNSLNASSLGNKSFILHVGLFYFLQNEDQLAAMICHEISHLLLNHTLRDIQYKYGLKKAPDLKEEISEIKNDNENKGDKAYKKLKNLLYEEGTHNKKQEFEADSLGYVLYRNTSFHKADYLNSFKLEEAYDTIRPIGLNMEVYKKIFHTPIQPFKDDWMKKEDFSKYDYSKFKEKYNEDSLQSHPKTDLRIKTLKKSFVELTNLEDPKKPTTEFLELQRISELEQPCTFEIHEEYGLGVYFCLFRIQHGDDVDYYKNRLGVFFQKIYDARKEYKLNRYLERVDPKEQPESYQQFLNFMWNLNLTEIKNIADYYTKRGY